MSTTDDRTDLTEQAVLPLLVTDGQGPGQFRISRVQILNWGAYAGLQTMTVARSGTAIVGPSGRGKSTLLDAMASVILPNPQEFNQAARDDRGKKRERTVYSYARGHTDQRQNAGTRAATTNYLRPVGGPGFATGAAITWETGDRRTVTAFRLAWVAADADGPDSVTGSTIYGFVHDHFDLTILNGITAVRQGASPLSKTSLERYVDLERGDLVDSSQARVHAKMRTVMGMGSTDESQRLAMQLLRRAQASKGIFSINALFKEFVLTEPLALTRWDVAIEAYREASRLYEEFEAARRRTETLAPLTVVAEKYRAAGSDYLDKHRMLAGDGTPRIAVWHAEKVVGWAAGAIAADRRRTTDLDELLGDARRAAAAAERREQDTIDRITAAGGDRSEALRLRMGHARETLDRIEADRKAVAARLSVFGYELPTSSAAVTDTHAQIDERIAREAAALSSAKESDGKASARRWQLRDAVAAKKKEIGGLQSRRSLIPEDADARRNRIVTDLGVEPFRVRYAGELLQLRADQRRWEKAVAGVLLPLASTLLVDSRDFARVRRYVHDNDMHGSITIAPAVSGAPRPESADGGVPALLDIADHPFQGWLAAELNETVNYLCVETETDLDGDRPGWARGALTPAGMRTGSRQRLTKDDRRLRYPWIGWDTHALVQELAQELESLEREARVAETAAAQTGRQSESLRSRVAEMRSLRTDLTWALVDTGAAGELVEHLRTQLDQANSPEVAHLDDLRRTQRDATVAALGRLAALEAERADLEEARSELTDVAVRARSVVEDEHPLADGERAVLAATPFAAPATAFEVTGSLAAAVAHLRDQVDRHQQDHEKLEGAVLGHLAAYRNLDERTARETDGTIDSLPSVLATYRQLVADDLPRSKSAWLAKVDEDMNRQLRGVLVQIDDDARNIRRGLAPINNVLRNVRFRQDATLAIETAERPGSDLKEFRQIVTRYTNGQADTDRDEVAVERSFVRLRRRLARLDDPSHIGEAWRRRVFDAREHVAFQAVQTRADGVRVVHDGVAGMSGGEGQELIAFILGAALRFRLGEGQDGPPGYASIILDEGFVKADSEFTGRALSALRALGFQVLVGAPREKATAFEDHVQSVAYINIDADNPAQVRIYPMTMAQALQLDGRDG